MALTRNKAGTSRASKERRQTIFVETYLTNGGNATQAAIAAGYSQKRARVTGAELVADRNIAAQITERSEKVLAEAQSTSERCIREMSAAAYVDPGRFYDADGGLIPLHKLPEDMRRSVSRIKGIGGEPEYEVDKQAALIALARHHGIFEKDNHQKSSAIQVNVQLLG